MSQQSLSELFRASNKLNYDIEGQINGIHYGRETASSQDGLKTVVIPQIKNKIGQLNTYMQELQETYEKLENGSYAYNAKKDDDNLVYWKK